jgi:hypothetical protein
VPLIFGDLIACNLVYPGKWKGQQIDLTEREELIMKTAAFMKRALELCAPLLFGLTIILSAGNIAQAQGDASPVPELEAAHSRVQEATIAMKQAEDQNNTRAMERARNNYNKANQNMAQNLARVAGVRTEDVTGMLRAGMGWEEIAQELGLEPEHLGIGKEKSQTTTPDRLNIQDRTRDRDRDRDMDRDFFQQDSTEPKRTRERERTRERLGQETPREKGLMVRERTRERNRELREATSRNMKKAGATKHGMAMVGAGSKGMGLGKAKGAMSAETARGSGGHGGSGSGGGGSGGGGGNGGGGNGGGGNGGGR